MNIDEVCERFAETVLDKRDAEIARLKRSVELLRTELRLYRELLPGMAFSPGRIEDGAVVPPMLVSAMPVEEE